MEKCSRCGRNEEEVRLFDGFYVNEDIKICEKCSLLANIPIIKRPSAEQLKASEKGYAVRERLSFLAGLRKEEKKEKLISEDMKKLQEKPELEKPEDLVFKLVDNFHWIIQTSRRRKGFSLNQLAEAIGESESALKMLERGIVPTKALGLIEKIEQFLKISLIKKEYYDLVRKEAAKPEVKTVIMERKVLDSPEKNPLGLKNSSEHMTRMRSEEANDMVKSAILFEKNVKLRFREEVEGVPLRASDFRRENMRGINLAEVKRMEDSAEKYFEIENMKTRNEIGREQIEGFGHEDTDKLKRRVFANESSKPKNKTPSIYELMRAKEERDRTSLIGKDIKFEKIEASVKPIEDIQKIEELSRVVRKKKGFFSKIKEFIGSSEEEKEETPEKIDFETGRIIHYK